MSAGRCRLAVLASHPIQYFTPIYKLLAKHPEIDLEVMFCRDFGVQPRFDKQFDQVIAWDTDQLDGYRHRFLINISPVRDTFNPLHAINLGAFTRLLGGYDAIWMNGYMYPSNWLAAAAAKLRGISILSRSELRLAPDRPKRRIDALRDGIIRRWVRDSDALLYIGEENRRAYLHYGATAARLFFSPYSVDVAKMREARARADVSPHAHRRFFGIPEHRVVVLFVGKLTSRKHPEAALVLAGEASLRDHIQLVFAGSGPLEADLRAATDRQGLSNVSFLGFVNQSRLPDLYAIGDVFLMPSEREPWGLVLNEAMASGMAAVVSDAVGASADLVTEGQTGFSFPSLNWEAMRRCVEALVFDETLRAQMAARASARAAEYSYGAAAAGVIEALHSLGHVRTPFASVDHDSKAVSG